MIRTQVAAVLEHARELGVEALTEALGPLDTVRFLQQFDVGHGDYTTERKRLLGNPALDQILDTEVMEHGANTNVSRDRSGTNAAGS